MSTNLDKISMRMTMAWHTTSGVPAYWKRLQGTGNSRGKNRDKSAEVIAAASAGRARERSGRPALSHAGGMGSIP